MSLLQKQVKSQASFLVALVNPSDWMALSKKRHTIS
jgi:hypothetical protein